MNLIPGMKIRDVNKICKQYGHIEKIMKTSTQSTSAMVISPTTTGKVSINTLKPSDAYHIQNRRFKPNKNKHMLKSQTFFLKILKTLKGIK